MTTTKTRPWRRGVVQAASCPMDGLIRGNIGIIKIGRPSDPEWRLIHLPSGLAFADRSKLAKAKELADWIETESDPKLLDELADGTADYLDPQYRTLRARCRLRS